MRAITNSDYRAHSAPLFSKLGILDIFQVNTFEIAKFMFYYRNNLLPPLLLNLFVTNSQIHNYGKPFHRSLFLGKDDKNYRKKIIKVHCALCLLFRFIQKFNFWIGAGIKSDKSSNFESAEAMVY